MFGRFNRDRRVLALAALALPCAGAARAQTSAELALVPGYAARGVALSRGPVAQLRIDYDAQDGWYGGGFASPVDADRRRQGQLIAYAGRAMRLSSFLSWDAGVSRTLYLRDSQWNTTEFYLGLSAQRAAARIFYSPAYYGQGRSVYVDLSGSYGLAEHVSLTAHAGWLHPVGSGAGAYGYGYVDGYGRDASARDRFDARIALAGDIGDVSLQAGWQGAWHVAPDHLRRAQGPMARVSVRF
jgi:uncharacterized protein (TIGR02001 family)